MILVELGSHADANTSTGTVRQLLVDDKGTVLIAVFGVPPLSHSDDASRGVRAAMGIQRELWSLDVLHTIGITYELLPFGHLHVRQSPCWLRAAHILLQSVTLMQHWERVLRVGGIGESERICCCGRYSKPEVRVVSMLRVSTLGGQHARSEPANSEVAHA